MTNRTSSSEAGESYVNKTFRLRGSSVARLESDANRMGISVNSLIQNCIQRYIEWDRYVDAVQMTAFFPNVLDNVLELVEVDTAERMAQMVVDTSCFKDVSLLVFKRYDPEVLLRLVSLLDRFGNNFRMQYGDGGAGGVRASPSTTTTGRSGPSSSARYSTASSRG